MQSLTVITTTPNRLLTKNLITGETYAKTSRLVAAERRSFASLVELKRLLKELAGQQSSCVIRGSQRDGWAGQLRRRNECFEDVAEAWVMLDIDDLKLPKSLSVKPYTDDVVRHVRAQLPAAFQDVSCVWQASASAGMKRSRAKLHLWFLLDAPLTAAQLRVWLKGAEHIDPSTLRAVQPHYTADPIGSPYTGKRVGICKGSSKRVTTPENLAELEPEPAAVSLERRPKGSADVADAQIAGAMKAAVKRSHELLSNCTVAYQDSYKVGALLGPAVALAFWNDKANGHKEECWGAQVAKLAARWGKRFDAVPGATHGPELYAARVHEGIVWGMSNERARLAERSQAALSEAVERTRELQASLLGKLARNAGSERVLQEVGKQLGRYAHVIGRDELLLSLQTYSGLSAAQCERSIEEGEAEPVDVSAWREGLLMQREDIVATDENMHNIFIRYPGFLQSFSYNVRTQNVEASDTNVLGLPVGPVNVEHMPRVLMSWLGSVGMRRASMFGAFNVFRGLQLREYDPFLERFPEALMSPKEAQATLATMKPKLHKWLRKYLGVERNVYTEAVAAKTLIAAVARAVRPGAQVDTMLVLVGEQGIGKTSAIRTLANVIPNGYRELLSMNDRDALLTMQAGLLVEMSELRVLRTTQEESVKAFITRTEDHVRAPYARTAQAHQRRMVFIGTTNDADFLSDRANRRYWPVHASKQSSLSADAAVELWREAALRYAAGETWWLAGEAAELQAVAVRAVRAANPYELILMKQLKNMTHVSFMEAARMCVPEGDVFRHSRAISSALKALGWEMRRNSKNNRWIKPVEPSGA